MAPGNNTTHHQRGGGGAGRGGGRGGRFNHQSNSGRGGGKPASKPTEKKYIFAPHTSGGKQTNYASYHSTVEHICQHIQAKFTNGHDCAKSLRESQKIDLSQEEPKRTMSTDPDEKVRPIIQAGYDIKYTAEITTHATRVQTLEANMTKAFSLILTDYCTAGMRQRLGEHPDWKTKIEDDPLYLLETIMSCMHDPVRAQYQLVTPTDFITTLLTCKQGTYPNEESLLDWSKRFKQNLELTGPYIGKAALDHYVETLPAYTAAAYKPSTKEEAAFEPMKHKFQWKETAEQKLIKLNNWKAFEAYLFIQGCDQSKYGSFTKNLQAQYSLNNDQYPKTLTAAVDALNQHRYDPKYFESKKKDRERRNNNNNRNTPSSDNSMPSQQTSFAQTTRATQRNSNQPPTNAVTTAICHCCGESGHISKYCPQKDTIAKNDWYVKRAIGAYQEPDSTVTSDNEQSTATTRTTRTTSSAPPANGRSGARTGNNQRAGNWQGFQFFNMQTDLSPLPTVHSHAQKSILGHNPGPFKTTPTKINSLRDVILLDSSSSIDGTFCNPALVTNVRPADRKIGMQTNAGVTTLDTQADVPGYGPVYLDPTHVTNIFGLANLVDTTDRVTFDSAVDDAFYVHNKQKISRFGRTECNLYAFKPPTGYRKSIFDATPTPAPIAVTNTDNSTACLDPEYGLLMTTNTEIYDDEYQFVIASLEENKLFYTERQFNDAHKARILYHGSGRPSLPNLKYATQIGWIKNNPCLSDDITRAKKIFGPAVNVLKGASVRPHPPRVRVDDIIQIPKEIYETHSPVEMSIDLLYISGMPMLTAIDHVIKFRSLIPLRSRNAENLYSALDKVFRVYNKATIAIDPIHADDEFRSLMEKAADNLDCTFLYAPQGEHVPVAERNNRTIADHIRIALHYLPFRFFPRLLVRWIAMSETAKLNWFPVKGGISEHYSPNMILQLPQPDYNRDIKVLQGSYVQAYQDHTIKNDNKARTIDALYLGPMKGSSTGHHVMNIATGLEVRTQKVTQIPITPLVIRAVEALAKKEGMTAIKIENKFKKIIYHNDARPGIDYDDNTYDSDSDSDSDDEEYIRGHGPDIDNDDLADEDTYDPIDQSEIDDLMTDDELPDLIAREPEAPAAAPVPPPARAPARGPPRMANLRAPAPRANPRPARVRAPAIQTHYSRFGTPDPAPQHFKTVTFAQSFVQLERLEQQHNMTPVGEYESIEYTEEDSRVVASLMHDIYSGVSRRGLQFSQQLMFHRGRKRFGKRADDAATKELDQLHRRNCFTPIDPANLTPEEKKRAQTAMMLVTEKRDESVKGRCVYDGSKTRPYFAREDTASPTVSQEAIFLTAVIDAHEGRDVMTADIPNAFIQADLDPIADGEARTIMKITGVLVDLLVRIAPEIYGPFVMIENGKRVLYLLLMKALYGMLVAALLWYRKFRGDLETELYVFNPYDPCVANKTIEKKQHTVRFHVDDLMASHVLPKINDRFDTWLNKMYGHYGAVKCVRGKVHDYLGMTLDFTIKGTVKFQMFDYVANMIDDFPVHLTKDDVAPTPAAPDLFASPQSPPLPKADAEAFHTFVAKGLFLCKRARPDTQTAISALCTRVKEPTQDDWCKLLRYMRYLNATRGDELILSADDLRVMKWYVDVGFAIHPDFKSHTGGGVTMGKGFPISNSRKQRLNTRSSTDSELVGADDMSQLILWTDLFMDAQGYPIKENILYQDNKSTILLLNNGKQSSTKRTRAINIRYFFLTDQIQKGKLRVAYCPTGQMIADFHSKPLQGSIFRKFKQQILGQAKVSPPIIEGDRSVLEYQHSSPNRIQSLTDPVRHSCDRSLKTDITSPKHGEAKTQKTNTNNKRQQLSL